MEGSQAQPEAAMSLPSSIRTFKVQARPLWVQGDFQKRLKDDKGTALVVTVKGFIHRSGLFAVETVNTRLLGEITHIPTMMRGLTLGRGLTVGECKRYVILIYELGGHQFWTRSERDGWSTMKIGRRRRPLYGELLALLNHVIET